MTEPASPRRSSAAPSPAETSRPQEPVYLRAPLFLPALGLGMGIMTDYYIALPIRGYFALAALAAAVLLACGRGLARVPAQTAQRDIWQGGLLSALGLLSLSSGAILFHAQYRTYEPNHLAWYVPTEPIFARLRGEILATPIVVDPPAAPVGGAWKLPPRTRSVLQVRQVLLKSGWQDVTGLVQLTVQQARPDLQQGDRIETLARLYRLPGPDNPGEFRWNEWQRFQRILLGATVEHPHVLEVLTPAERSPGLGDRLLAKFRRLAAFTLHADVVVDDPHAVGLLDAMVLGQRSATDRAIETAFQRTGTTHMLSVSGFHLVFLAALAWVLARLLTRRLILQGLTVLTLVFSYLLLAEPTPPLIRSAVVCVVGALALILSRPASSLNWLAGSFIVTLTLNPGDLFSAGFQLSFISLIGLIYLAPVLHQRWFGRLAQRLRPRLAARMPWWKLAWRSTARIVSETAAVSVAAALAGCAVGWYHFGAFSPYAPLNSVLLALPVGLMLVIGYIKWLVSGFLLLLSWMGLASEGNIVNLPLAWILSGLLILLSNAVLLLSHLPGALVRWPPPPLWLLLGYLAVLAWWAYRRKLGRSGTIALAAVMLAYPLSLQFGTHPPKGEAWFDLLAVGQGQAAFLRSDDGRVLLCDCGTIGPFDQSATTIVPYLRNQGIRRIDAAIISHPDWDHYGGLSDLQPLVNIGPLRVTEQLATAASPSVSHFRRNWQKAGGQMETLFAGDAWSQGQTMLTVLWPPRGLDSNRLKLTNLSSLVIRVEFSGQRLLICGDIQPSVQEVLVEEHRAGRLDLRAAALVLPHHGRPSAMYPAFIQAVNPTICLRSDMTRTDWSLADWSLPLRGREYHNTADEGALRLILSASGVRVEKLVKP